MKNVLEVLDRRDFSERRTCLSACWRQECHFEAPFRSSFRIATGLGTWWGMPWDPRGTGSSVLSSSASYAGCKDPDPRLGTHFPPAPSRAGTEGCCSPGLLGHWPAAGRLPLAISSSLHQLHVSLVRDHQESTVESAPVTKAIYVDCFAGCVKVFP